ncbi:hypothetical protein MMC12_007960 [Toensbergia leucococca]|nr:hypothetical protein [Toensbergia leucococca]
MAWGNQSFATFLIVGPTCFFLGILFSLFPYDYPLLWTSIPIPDSYTTTYETHLTFLHASPPIIPRILHIVIAVGLLGFFLKLYRPTESNMLFDGASLVLYMCGVTIYITNIVRGLRVISSGDFGGEGEELGEGEMRLGRVDGLRVLAASNTILALVMVGVLVLQAGQWYAERKEGQEAQAGEKMRKEKGKRNGSGSGSGSGNGSQTSGSTKKKN